LQIEPWPNFSRQESDIVSQVLLSNKVNYWTGQEGRLFEQEFAAFCEAKYAVAVANGSLALDLCLHALSIGARNGGSASDEVIVTSRTFIASASAIVLAGATPVFVDVELDSQNISARTIAPNISHNTKAIIAVHLAGWPCEMDEINALAAEFNLKVIEDCAQAHGATYKGRSVGSLGDVAAWSFCQDKIMSTGGEGGMFSCNNEAYWQRAWSYKDHGKNYDTVYHQEHPPGFRWLHESFGNNFRLTEMQSAIGRYQLKQMPMWQQKRSEHAESLNKILSRFPGIHIPQPPSYIRHAHYKHYAFVKEAYLAEGWTRDRIVDALNAEAVPCFQGSCSEVYLEKAFVDAGIKPHSDLLQAKQLAATSLMFLVHPSLSPESMQFIASTITRILQQAFKEQA